MSQKPHLDDLFAAARREEPVISHHEIGELIHARHTQSASQLITWKGIGMTTVGLGLVGVLSYFAFFSSQDSTAPARSVAPTLSTRSAAASAPAPQMASLPARLPQVAIVGLEAELPDPVVRVE